MQPLLGTSHRVHNVVGVEGGDDKVDASGELRLFSRALPFSTTQRNVLSLFLILGTCAWFWLPLGHLLSLALESEHFSYIVLVPFVSLYLLFLNRQAILASEEWNPVLGSLLLTCGTLFHWGVGAHNETTDELAIAIVAFVTMCWGLFLICFGGRLFRKNAFALLFLLFMVPLPTVILDTIIGFLQRSSAEAAHWLFSAIGIPMFRDGFIFSLSNFTIHVAEECSGIRSFLSLFITSVAAGYWLLKSSWARIGLAVAVVPLAIIKNASRIVGLALLANYVDPTYITNSTLHRTGGIPVFLVSLLFLFSLAWLLRVFEKRVGDKSAQRGA